MQEESSAENALKGFAKTEESEKMGSYNVEFQEKGGQKC
jgi:hypothetical protein